MTTNPREPMGIGPQPGSNRRAALLIVGVFLLLALVAAGLFVALKLTQPEKSLMGTTATADDKPDPATIPPAVEPAPTEASPAAPPAVAPMP